MFPIPCACIDPSQQSTWYVFLFLHKHPRRDPRGDVYDGVINFLFIGLDLCIVFDNFLIPLFDSFWFWHEPLFAEPLVL